jgi:general secretion pathway protein G
MQVSTKKAFTMVELVFVIVVIGILSAIAIPKFAATRDDAVITSAIATIGSVRSALASERQKRILRGDFTAITAVDGTVDATANDVAIFDFFDNVDTTERVLEYPIRTCATSTTRGCWIGLANNEYRFRMPHNANNVDFNITSSRFECKLPNSDDCKLLTK